MRWKGDHEWRVWLDKETFMFYVRVYSVFLRVILRKIAINNTTVESWPMMENLQAPVSYVFREVLNVTLQTDQTVSQIWSSELTFFQQPSMQTTNTKCYRNLLSSFADGWTDSLISKQGSVVSHDSGRPTFYHLYWSQWKYFRLKNKIVRKWQLMMFVTDPLWRTFILLFTMLTGSYN